ncbi:MAG: PAS domain-containing sensor histidine kinase [Ferrovibrio sp.]|uniref:sensor histidine kinase n=1 Tax=Ferrovibrio sp. TaxID=1917215 RepID=UPI00262F5E59|nr:PAS domain-containing sensor histidine kinase [Ferrovibrio sp.]MCW0236264.1 PAS domain-containing sensor histidine kinase [Ferrovibrio sp.]
MGMGWIAAFFNRQMAGARIRELESRLTADEAVLQTEIERRRIAEQRFHDVTALSADWIWETDANLIYTYMSDQVELVTGVPAAGYIGQSRISLFGDDNSADPFLKLHIEDMKAHRPFAHQVQWLNRPRGLVCISVSGRPRFNETGDFTGYVGIGRDITEEQQQRRRRDEMNHALAEARDQALRASKSKSSFLAHMSHELRTPMNAILGFAEVMRDQVVGPLDDRYRGYAGHIHESAQHLLSLINDVLDLSKIEAGAYELHESHVDLPAIAARALRQVEGAAREGGVMLTLDMPADLPPLWADQRAVFQIMLNLLSNGIKFTPSGGAVAIFALREPAGGIAFGVRDTGIGMNESDIAKALQRFGQVDNVLTREHQGSGLGLPLVQELALLHGGQVGLTSQPGEGTTVTVRFGADRVENRV